MVLQFYIVFTVLFSNMQTLKFKPAYNNIAFLLPSIIIINTTNEPWNTETHKVDWNPPIANHKPLTLIWTRWSKLLFPKKSATMIDGSKEHKR